jgi:hypothetical protein
VNRRIATIIAAGAAGAFAFSLPLHALPPGTENFNQSQSGQPIDCDGGTLTFHAPSALWPPNHKYYDDVYVLAEGDEGTEQITLTSDGTHDQYDGDNEANGSGHTGDDIVEDDAEANPTPETTPSHQFATESGTGTVQTDWDVRAERAGTIKDARVYTLHAIATFDDGQPCEGSVQMSVPHDMRKSNRS